MNAREKIYKLYSENKRMPSYQELAKILQFKSKQASFRTAKKLIEENFLAKDTKGYLIPGENFFKVPLLGTVKTGFPSPADDYSSESIDLNVLFSHSPTATFIAQASGDSMIEAGIVEGDYLSIRKDLNPRNGDIVIARIDNEFTCKYYNKRKNSIILTPANKNYKEINLKKDDDFEIWGVVTGVARKLV